MLTTSGPFVPAVDMAAGASTDAGNWTWDPLISFPAAQLNKVHNGKEEQLGNGVFSIYMVTQEGSPSSVVAVLGSHHMWEIQPDAPSMRVGAQTYMFTAPKQQAATGVVQRWWSKQEDVFYYSVTICEEIEAESLGVLEAVLEAVSPYKESSKLADSERPNEAEYLMAQQAQAFFNDSFSETSGSVTPVKKEGASDDAEQWVPVPHADGSYGLQSMDEVEEQAGRPSYTSKRAQMIYGASKRMASGVTMAAQWGSKKMMEYGEASKTRLQANEKPVEISDSALKRLEQTAKVAGWASKAAGVVVSAIGAVAGAVGGAVVRRTNKGKGMDPESKTGQIVTASMVGFTEVYEAMERAAELVYRSARDTTAGVVDHKYGPSASMASTHVMNAGGHAVDTWWAARRIGVKAVAKATAKSAASQLLKDMVKGHGKSSTPAPAPMAGA